MSMIILISFIVLLVLLFMKVPVYIAILASSLLYFLLNPGVNSIVYAQQVVGGTESISLLAIPFFVLLGALMNYSGVSNRIYDFAGILTGRMRGGLAQVNVLVSTLMGGLSGSNLADAAMDSKMLVPQMERKGFSKPFSSVVTATSSMITPLIPPGIAMILYQHRRCFHRQTVCFWYWRRSVPLWLFDAHSRLDFQEERLHTH